MSLRYMSYLSPSRVKAGGLECHQKAILKQLNIDPLMSAGGIAGVVCSWTG